MAHFFGRRKQAQSGYTLVELMVAVALTGIVTVAIYKAYVSVSTSYDVQDQVVELQQNSRVAMDRLIREIRMAGYDPERTAGAGFLSAGSNQVSFSVDVWPEDGVLGSNETITYTLNAVAGPPALNFELQRTRGGATTTVIDDIGALDFVYLDANQAVTANLADIRTVQLAVVVHASNEDYGYTDNRSYVNLQGATILAPQNDNFHRRLVTAEVKVRNLGL